MFIKKIKTVIKSIPIVNKILLPFGGRQRKARWRKREKDRFREYCRNLPNMISEPFFVKVGANDGIINDPCSDILLANPNWRGLLIEPVPYCFDRLKENFQDSRRFSFEQVAIGESTGEAVFYYVNEKANESIPNLPVWFSQIGSFDKNHILKHLKGVLGPFIIEHKVQTCGLSDLLIRNQIRDIHLLHVDTEGHDYVVLKTLDFSKHTPLSIFIEHGHLSDSQKKGMLGLLHKNGYSVRDGGRDYFAINNKANKKLQLQRTRS